MTKTKIGWIGTGVMGNAMCEHIINSGYQVFVYNRTQSKADNLISKGAKWCKTPDEVAQNSSIIFSIVGFPSDVEFVLTGEKGVLGGAKPETIIVDMTTSSPALATKIYETAREKSVSVLDAPVSGGDVGARNASLSIMVGGNASDFDKVQPFLQILGKNIAYMGPSGLGQHTKMCNQILIAGTMIGTVESLLYAHRMGMDMDAVIDVIGQGAASSWSINNLGRRIAKKDFNPGFMIKHFIKDMGIALAEAQRLNLSLPGLALAHQFYIAAQAMGHGDLGTQGLFRVLAKLNHMKI